MTEQLNTQTHTHTHTHTEWIANFTSLEQNGMGLGEI